jgi:hypothetical protein
MSPEGSILAEELSAIDQMEWVKRLQTEWADNAVSVTIYYRKQELPEIQEWLSNNYNNSVKSMSFLLHQDHGFALPPYEEIDEEGYNKMLAKIDPTVPLVKTEGELIDDNCDTGHCPVR